MTSSIAAIHVARKQLDLDEDVYRAKLVAITGKSSAKDMTEAERQKVLGEFRKVGFRPAPGRSAGRRQLAGPYAKKLQALWIAAWNLGLVDYRDDKAMLAFVKRQTGLDDTRFLHHAEDGRAAIEGLKAWLKREADVMFGNLNGCEWLAADGAKIAWAQWRVLHPGANLMVRKGFDQAVEEILGARLIWLADVKPKDWQAVMNALGPRVRAARKAGTP
ncbi:regulatory protein GemA [Shinella sp.]|uniref:regulatory protein GemA n=1 Tax=Shinella sp. TaxID=1870904 RepID=UPI00258DBFA7|nr:regulatory protein GemA [Shinella sp.]MCW5708693.1 regulatory protein GemA [Shinella sp.]